MNSRNLIIAAGIAGIAIGVLSTMPVLSLVNCLLCGWVWGGAIFAVWLYKRNEGPSALVSTGQGALIGLIAGLIGAVISSVIGLALGGSVAAQLEQIAAQADPQTREIIQQIGAGGFSLIVLLFSLLFFAIFGAIGGLIGAALFGKPRMTPTM